MSKKETKTFDELWEELKNDKEYGDQIRFIDRVVNQDKENERLKHQLEEEEKEIDKLEQELAFYNEEVKSRGTCGLCEKLENREIEDLRHQLAEKDKEIERLKEWATWYKESFDSSCRNFKILRHQVCEEIRETFDNKDYELYGDNHRILSIQADDFNNKLDQIEKGE